EGRGKEGGKEREKDWASGATDEAKGGGRRGRRKKKPRTAQASSPAVAVYGTEMGGWKKNKKGRDEGHAQVPCLTGRPTRRGSTGGRQKNPRATLAGLVAGQASEE